MRHVEQRDSSAFEVETGTRNAPQDASISRRTLQCIQLESALGMDSALQWGAPPNAGLREAQSSVEKPLENCTRGVHTYAGERTATFHGTVPVIGMTEQVGKGDSSAEAALSAAGCCLQAAVVRAAGWAVSRDPEGETVPAASTASSRARRRRGSIDANATKPDRSTQKKTAQDCAAHSTCVHRGRSQRLCSGVEPPKIAGTNRKQGHSLRYHGTDCFCFKIARK